MSVALVKVLAASETYPVMIRVPRDCFSAFVLANYVGIDWHETVKHNDPALLFLYDLMVALCPNKWVPMLHVKDNGIVVSPAGMADTFDIPTHDIGEACYLLCDAVAKRLLAQPVVPPPSPVVDLPSVGFESEL